MRAAIARLDELRSQHYRRAHAGGASQQNHTVKYDIRRVDVWSGEVRDRRGALANTLKAVLDAGADLDFIIVRPSPVKPATGIVYIAPLEGEGQEQVARKAGLHPSSHIASLRIEGPDRQGLAEQIARLIAEADININGFTGGRMGDRCVIYIRVERADELAKAQEIVEASLA